MSQGSQQNATKALNQIYFYGKKYIINRQQKLTKTNNKKVAVDTI